MNAAAGLAMRALSTIAGNEAAKPARRLTRAEVMAAGMGRSRPARTRPLERSNPFTHDARRKAFDESVARLTEISGNPEWVRRQAAKAARRVPAHG